MSEIMKNVDKRTQLVGQNRLEMLTFRLHGPQLYAINVFKVFEVQTTPKLNHLPMSSPLVVGVTTVRGSTISVIDLSAAIGYRSISPEESSNIIVTEYNRSVQAFLVREVEHIVNLNWDEILPPPVGTGHEHYLTAITQMKKDIVEIIDVEKVLAQIILFETEVSEEVLDLTLLPHAQNMEVLLVDDSAVALTQARETLSQLGIKITTASNGKKGLEKLLAWANDGINVCDKILAVVTDAEMPEMDGYRLTTEIRNDPRLRNLHVILHTSLSGSFNKAMVQKVGCDDFLSKFQPDLLADAIQKRIRLRVEQQACTD